MTADKKDSSLPSSLSQLHVSLTNGGNDNVGSSSLSNETKEQKKTEQMSSYLPEIKFCKDETSEEQSISKDHLFESPPHLSNVVSLSPEVDNSSNGESSQTKHVFTSTVTQDSAKADQSLPENDQIIHSQPIQISTVQSKLSVENGIDTLPLQLEKTTQVSLPPSSLNGSAIKSQNGQMYLSVELAPSPVGAKKLPIVSPLVEDSQRFSDTKELSQKPLLPVHVKIKISAGGDEVFEEERPSVFEDHFSEDEGSPPPLPKRTVVVPPPPPLEESDDEESPPLSIKKMTDNSSVVVPVSSQGEPKKHGIPPPPPRQDSEDDVAPPLPVKKQSKEENVSVEENAVPEARSIQLSPLSKMGSDSISSIVSVSSTTGSPIAKRQPPIPPWRTVSAVTPPSRSLESNSGLSYTPPPPLPKKKTFIPLPPPLPKKKTFIPLPPPPTSNTDSDSEDDGGFVHKRSLVAIKSVPLQDCSDLSSGNILLFRSKDSTETYDSSNDGDYRSETKVISQPLLDDTIALSSTRVTPDDGIGKTLMSVAEISDVVPSQKRASPPVKQQLHSPPTLSEPLSTPPPVKVTIPSSVSKSASYDATALLSNNLVTSVYSQIRLPPEQMQQQVLMMIICVCVRACVCAYICVSACVCVHVWHVLSDIIIIVQGLNNQYVYSEVGLPPSQKTPHEAL